MNRAKDPSTRGLCLLIGALLIAVLTPVRMLAADSPAQSPTAAGSPSSDSPAPTQPSQPQADGGLPALTPSQYKKGQSTPQPTDRQSSDTGWLATPIERLQHEPLEAEPLVEEPLTFEDAEADYTPRGLVESRNQVSRREQLNNRLLYQQRSPRVRALADPSSTAGEESAASANPSVTGPLPSPKR